MSLCAAVAQSSQSSTFGEDPLNIQNINSLVKGKQTKAEHKWFDDKIHLKAQVILKHLHGDISLDLTK